MRGKQKLPEREALSRITSPRLTKKGGGQRVGQKGLTAAKFIASMATS